MDSVSGVASTAGIGVNALIDGKTGTNSTLTAADTIAGKAGALNNVLTLTVANSDFGASAAAVADATGGANISGIQTVSIRNANATGANGLATLDATKITGLTTVNVGGGTGDVTVTGLAAGGSFGLVGNGTTTLGAISFGSAAAATSQTLNVSGGTLTGAIVLTGAGSTSATINSTGAANKIGALTLATTETALTINATTNLTTGAITDAALATVTVTGAAPLVTLSALPAAALTVNASGMTVGGVKFTEVAGFKSFVGGANNNFVTTASSAIATTAVINAGTGTGNTLDVAITADVNTTTIGAQYKGFNILQVESGVALDATLLAANNTITAATVNGGAVAGAATVTSLTNLAAGVAVAIGNSGNATAAAANSIDYSNAGSSLTIGVKGATTVGQIDTLTLNVNDSVSAANALAAAGATSIVKLGAITATGVENIVINVSNAGDTANVSALTGLVSTSNIKFAGAGAASLTLGAVTPITNSTFDASGLTGKFTADFSAALTNAVAIKGGVGASTITLQNTAVVGDTIDLTANVGGKSSILTGTATGNATITLGTHSASDTINVLDGAFVDGGTVGVTIVNNFNIASTAAVSDILKLAAAQTVLTGGTYSVVATGVANLTGTSLNGVLTFAGTGLATATTTQLIGAAEKIVNAAAANTIVEFVSGGNAYVVDSAAGNSTATDHIIQLVGVSTITGIGTVAGSGVLVIA